MPLLESKLEKKSVKYAEDIGYLTFKVSPLGQRGWPDRVFINMYGFHLYIEIKASKKKLRNLQIHRIQQLRDRGVSAYWADNFRKIKSILDDNVDTPSVSVKSN